jgi:hypothetical protein
MQFPELIDASLLSSFKSCPELCRKVYFEHFKSKEPSVHLHAGAAFAFGIERSRTAFYVEGKDAETAVAEGIGALLQFYGDFQCPADSAKSAERMAGAFEFYFANYPLAYQDDHGNATDPVILPGGKRAIEVNFAEPLPIMHPDSGDPLIYCGRLDAILNYAGGRYITDEKTTTQLGASWSRQWDLRSQFTGYAWGARQIGIKVDGALVRGISILKTKFDTQQAISYRPDWVIDRWYAEMLWWVSQMVEAFKKDVWIHNFDHACAEYGGCQFREACSSQDETPWLETYFERRAWNPLLRTETKL